MTDPKPDLVKMAREALKDRPLEQNPRVSVMARAQNDALRDLARAVIDQLGPKPLKVAGWVVVDRDAAFVGAYQRRGDAETYAKFLSNWIDIPMPFKGPYRAIYVTGEEGVGPE